VLGVAQIGYGTGKVYCLQCIKHKAVRSSGEYRYAYKFISQKATLPFDLRDPNIFEDMGIITCMEELKLHWQLMANRIFLTVQHLSFP